MFGWPHHFSISIFSLSKLHARISEIARSRLCSLVINTAPRPPPMHLTLGSFKLQFLYLNLKTAHVLMSTSYVSKYLFFIKNYFKDGIWLKQSW